MGANSAGRGSCESVGRFVSDPCSPAGAAGIACHAATSLEGPIGTVASLHLACAEPGFNYGSELFGPLLLAETYVTEPIRYEEGRVHLPEGPGLDVEPDHDAVERFTRR